MSEVVSIRVSKELKEAMKKVKVNWRREIENFIRERIRQYLKEYYLKKARIHRTKMPKFESTHAEWIRKDRDER